MPPGATRVAAHAFTLAVSLNPTFVLYENLLLYTYPEALCVLAGFWALLRTGLSQDHPFALHYPRDPGFGIPFFKWVDDGI